MGALVGQECIRITAGQFCSMIVSVQYRLPTYYKWLLYEADHRASYRYHRMFLQHLQSGVGGGGRYTWADTGLDAGLIREQVRDYQERYRVPTEPLE
jgi:hypothetical protein